MSDGSKTDDACCENCFFAEETTIDGLVDCDLDGKAKDFDMVCDCWIHRD